MWSISECRFCGLGRSKNSEMSILCKYYGSSEEKVSENGSWQFRRLVGSDENVERRYEVAILAILSIVVIVLYASGLLFGMIVWAIAAFLDFLIWSPEPINMILIITLILCLAVASHFIRKRRS